MYFGFIFFDLSVLYSIIVIFYSIKLILSCKVIAKILFLTHPYFNASPTS